VLGENSPSVFFRAFLGPKGLKNGSYGRPYDK